MMNLVSDLTRCLIRRARVAPAFLLLGLSFLQIQGAHAETAKVVLQYGISYLPLSVMQAEEMWERRAKELGLDLRVEWQNLRNGGGDARGS